MSMNVDGLHDKETMRRVAKELRPDIDDAEFEVLWLLYIGGNPNEQKRGKKL